MGKTPERTLLGTKPPARRGTEEQPFGATLIVGAADINSLDSPRKRARNYDNRSIISGWSLPPIASAVPMTTYRLYLRDAEKQIVGRDDFDSDNDARALLVARMLRDACSDKCAGFELWQNTRRVDLPCPNWSKFSADEIHAKVEAIVLDRELAIRDSRWTISDSARLLEQSRRLLNKAGGLG